MKRRSRAGSEPIKGRRRKAQEPKRRNASKAVAPSSSSGTREETENARLARELKEALERQSASSQVLQVISSFAGELDPVFQTILANATRICEAKFGVMQLLEGDGLRAVSFHDVPPAYAEAMRRDPVFRPNVGHPLERVASTKQVVHIADASAEQNMRGWIVELAGARTLLLVPMLKDNKFVGVISIYRQEVRPFTDKQIELVKNFAAQAVIAIENARLLNELRQRTDDLTERTADLTEALEQQTATSEVLQVISSSPGDLQPVFASMLEKAVRICDAQFGMIFRLQDDVLLVVATHNAPPAFAEFRRRSPLRPHPQLVGRAVATKKAVHVADLAAEQPYIEQRDPGYIAAVELGGVRTFLAVPMLKEDELIGLFTVYRHEVRPFSDKQIALVTNFAAQAVIAIENARLLNELRQRTTDLTERTADLTEALEQQTATSEVLQVISGSPSDLQPVFAAMLEKAVRICDATFGNVYRWDGEVLHLVATHNTPPAFAEARRRSLGRRDDKNQMLALILANKKPLHVADAAALPGYINRSDLAAVQTVELGGVRSLLAVPMLKEGELIGGFTVYRQEVRPFTDKQIELVKNFAAQAVIAIENARLLNELRQSLEQQTATAEVLQVISSSPGDLQPVFAIMVENAVRICHANWGNIHRWEDEALHLVASHNPPPAFAAFRRSTPDYPPHPKALFGRLLATKTVTQIIDSAAVEAYTERLDPVHVAAVELGGARTALAVPMLKDNQLIGAFALIRQEVQPFTDKQIELVKNFAAQAVIAIENARLLNELRQRTTDLTERSADLTEALEQQTATSEVLQVISSSPGDLQPVFEAMLEKGRARL